MSKSEGTKWHVAGLPEGKQWGNLAMNEGPKGGGYAGPTKKPVTPPAPKDSEEVLEENAEMLAGGYKVPALNLRMDICKNFPIVVKKLPDSRDGIDRYALEWDRRTYHPMHAETPTSKDSYDNFPFYAVWRMIYALRQRSDVYTIEPPRTRSEICVIAMAATPAADALIRSTRSFMLTRGVQIPQIPPEPADAHLQNYIPPQVGRPLTESAATEGDATKATATKANATKANATKGDATRSVASHQATPHPAAFRHATPPRAAPHGGAGAAGGPMLRTLNDIKAHFPVAWHHDYSRNLYLLDIHGKKLKENAEGRAGHSLTTGELAAERRRVEEDLMAALTASDAWTVYNPKGANAGHFAVLSVKPGRH